MILDIIIAAMGSLFIAIIDGVLRVFELVANLVLAGVEMVIRLFVSGFRLGRVAWGKRPATVEAAAGASRGTQSARGKWVLLVMLAIAVASLLAPEVWMREITLKASDGRGLPFAGVTVQTRLREERRRTDATGKLEIPRFGTRAITLSDPRYVRTVWKGREIESTLTVERTILGTGLDRLAGDMVDMNVR